MINPAIPKAPPWKRIWFFFLPLALRDMQEWIEYRKRESLMRERDERTNISERLGDLGQKWR